MRPRLILIEILLVIICLTLKIFNLDLSEFFSGDYFCFCFIGLIIHRLLISGFFISLEIMKGYHLVSNFFFLLILYLTKKTKYK